MIKEFGDLACRLSPAAGDRHDDGTARHTGTPCSFAWLAPTAGGLGPGPPQDTFRKISRSR